MLCDALFFLPFRASQFQLLPQIIISGNMLVKRPYLPPFLTGQLPHSVEPRASPDRLPCFMHTLARLKPIQVSPKLPDIQAARQCLRKLSRVCVPHLTFTGARAIAAAYRLPRKHQATAPKRKSSCQTSGAVCDSAHMHTSSDKAQNLGGVIPQLNRNSVSILYNQ